VTAVAAVAVGYATVMLLRHFAGTRQGAPSSFRLSGGSTAKGESGSKFKEYQDSYGASGTGQGIVDRDATPGLVDTFYRRACALPSDIWPSPLLDRTTPILALTPAPTPTPTSTLIPPHPQPRHRHLRVGLGPVLPLRSPPAR